LRTDSRGENTACGATLANQPIGYSLKAERPLVPPLANQAKQGNF